MPESFKIHINKAAAIAAALLCAGTPASSYADNSAKRFTYNNPVIRRSTPDPTVIRAADGYFYLYGTEDTHNMPIYRSRNLVDWIFLGTAFTDATRPRTLSPYVRYTGDDGKVYNPGIWAPDINYFNGQYVLYYSIGVWGWGWKCGIGVATSERPEGPFVDRGAVFMSEDANIRVNGSIDQFFIEEDGKKYLVWGSYNSINIIQLTDDGLRVMPGATKQKLCANQMEGSYIHKRNGYYYLIGSNGSCCEGANSTYRLIYGRSTSLFGPYVTKSGARLADSSANFEILLEGDDYCAGPGHNAEWIDDDNGDTWVIYHGYLKAQADLGRVVWLDQVKWDGDWPYIEGGKPSRQSKLPYFKDVE